MLNALKTIQSSVLLPVIVVASLLVILFISSNGSVWDFVADRVIDRMEAKYSPYGPQPPQVTVGVPQYGTQPYSPAPPTNPFKRP